MITSMKMYLSSYGLGNEPEYLTNLIGDNKAVAVIANAWDLSDEDKRAGGLPEKFESLHNLGLIPEEIDLRNYFGQTTKLHNDLSQFGTLWIQGGNSFVLLRAMNMSGFKTAIIDRVMQNDLVYAGYSAGACVVGPNLNGIDLVDDPNAVPDGYPIETPWEGLNLIDFSVVPHYRSDHPESEAIKKTVSYFVANTLPYKTLRDGEAIVISEEGFKIVG